MIDSKLAGTGNSRFLKSVSNFKTLYPTYDDFVAALVAGTLPIDLNGINPDGWTQQGTPLNKANLLSDDVATKLGLVDDATPSGAFGAIVDAKGVSNGFATLDATGKVPSAQLPSMNYIPTSQKGVANGVATLDSNLKLPISQLTTNVEMLSPSALNVRAYSSNIDVFDYEVKSYIKYGPFLLISINAYAQDSGRIPLYFPILISNLGYTIVSNSSLISAKYFVFTSGPSLTNTGGTTPDAMEVYAENSASNITCTFKYNDTSYGDYNYCAVGFTVLALINN